MKTSQQQLYLVRHGQTTADKDRIIGKTDLPLSATGLEQATRLAETLTPIYQPCIYTSALIRAVQTAAVLPGQTQPGDKNASLINEMNFGDWENQTWDVVYNQDPDFFNHWAQNWETVAPPNGESFNEVIARTRDWYNELIIPEEQAIIVAHGGSLRALLCIVLDLPASAVLGFEFSHCHVSKLILQQNNAKAAYLNNPVFSG